MSDTHTIMALIPGRVDAVVAHALPELSRARVAKLVKKGHVRVQGEVVGKPSFKVEVGMTVDVVVPPPEPTHMVPQDLPLDIVFEDDDLVVVNKAPGMVVHPGAGHRDGTLVNALLFHVRTLSGIGGVERPGIVHRLDRGTSGLMVVAKNDLAHQGLSEQFATHEAHRRYLALCMGVPKESSGTIVSWLARHPKDRVRFASGPKGRGKRAVTHWWARESQRNLTLVECRLETGRTHQIRVHMTEHGLPLVNDPMYRRRDRKEPRWLQPHLLPERPMLHAWHLYLRHPRTGEALAFVAQPPEDFLGALEEAGIAMPEAPAEQEG